MNKYMKIAIKEALKGMKEAEGGPFGAVIIKDGQIIVKAHNQVLKNQDATCHAEMQAIRKACDLLGTFDLSDCEIYTSCEPCPMCYGAIRWAKINKIFYGCTAQDAHEINFSDKQIYNEIQSQSQNMVNMDREECLKAFKEWTKLNLQQY